MKKFVTLFWKMPAAVLMKDVGMIPYYLGKQKYYDTKLVSSKIKDEDYGYLEDEMINFKTELSNSQFFFLREILYVFYEAKNIDILNLYHLNLRTGLLIFIYKLLNSQGFVYLKLDIDYRTINKIENSILKKNMYSVIIQKADFVSAESTYMLSRLSKLYRKKIELIPNGLPDLDFEGHKGKNNNAVKNYDNLLMKIRSKSYHMILLTVGRLGTQQKNTELLINSFIAVCDKRKDVALLLIGERTNQLNRLLNEKKCCDIYAIGNIYNKDVLYQFYQLADVFVLTSRWEGFPLVIPEALWNGCYLLLSDAIAPAQDIIIDNKVGSIFKSNDITSLISAINNACDLKTDIISCNKEYRHKLCEQKYTWSKITNYINEVIEKTKNEK